MGDDKKRSGEERGQTPVNEEPQQGSALHVNPGTGMAYPQNPETGEQYDPVTGQPIDPATGKPQAAAGSQESGRTTVPKS